MTATLISLLAVTFGFAGLVLWVFWPSHKDRLEELGRIPLDEPAEEATPEQQSGRAAS